LTIIDEKTKSEHCTSEEFKNMAAVKMKKEKFDEEAVQSSAIPNKKERKISFVKL
jgi:hypothetical protein